MELGWQLQQPLCFWEVTAWCASGAVLAWPPTGTLLPLLGPDSQQGGRGVGGTVAVPCHQALRLGGRGAKWGGSCAWPDAQCLQCGVLGGTRFLPVPRTWEVVAPWCRRGGLGWRQSSGNADWWVVVLRPCPPPLSPPAILDRQLASFSIKTIIYRTALVNLMVLAFSLMPFC